MSKIIHLTADSRNLDILKAFHSEEDNIHIEAIPDYLTDGPLADEATNNFDTIRHAYRQSLLPQATLLANEETEGPVAMMMRLSSLMTNDDDYGVIYWMGANAFDVIGYFFVLHYLKKHAHRIQVINIAGLPFLNEDFKLIFPTHIFQLPPNQLQKALKLARPLSIAEVEIDGEEWKALRTANAMIRTLDGNKRISNQPEHFFDSQLTGLHKENAKINKTVQTAFHKNLLPISPLFIENRLNNIMNKNNATIDDTNAGITAQ